MRKSADLDGVGAPLPWGFLHKDVILRGLHGYIAQGFDFKGVIGGGSAQGPLARPGES